MSGQHHLDSRDLFPEWSRLNANSANTKLLGCPDPRLLDRLRRKTNKVHYLKSTRDRRIEGSSSVKMRVRNLLTGLLATAIPSVSATALTYKLDANEKACFFAEVDQVDAKVAFYFAVSLLSFANNYLK